jgi:hypothetical protein
LNKKVTNRQRCIEHLDRFYKNDIEHDKMDKFLMKADRMTNNFLKMNDDIFILSADKNCGTVAITRDEYFKRMHYLLDNISTYDKLDYDPTSKCINTTKRLIKDLFDSKLITFNQKKNFNVDAKNSPCIHGLPKLHKWSDIKTHSQYLYKLFKLFYNINFLHILWYP